MGTFYMKSMSAVDCSGTASAVWQVLDWRAPWMQPYREGGTRLAQVLAQQPGASVADQLNAMSQRSPRRFVPQSDLPAGEAYEAFIARTGAVPTRDHLHDALNGLVWQRFPHTKAKLNTLQSQAIAQQGVGAVRGPLRDALTLFDENGTILLAPDALWQALRARQWQRLFVDLRPLWRDAELVLLGHALLEKLAQPRKPITAHVFCHPLTERLGDNTDAVIATALSGAHLATKPYTPLPVMGVPGWCEENENFSFYDDSCVFRKARLPELR